MVYVSNINVMRNISFTHRNVVYSLVYILIDKFFLFYCFSWIIIRITRKGDIPIPYLNNWLTDFVFVPLIAHIAFVSGNVILRLSKPYTYPLYQICIISFLTSILFEGILPLYTPYNTFDSADIGMYFLGAAFYYYSHQRYAVKQYKKVF